MPSDLAELNHVVVGSGISVEGQLNPLSKSSDVKQLTDYQCSHELHAKQFQLFDIRPQNINNTLKTSICTLSRFSPRPHLGLLRSSGDLEFRHRLPEFSALLRMRAKMKHIFREVMDYMEYLEVILI